MTVIFEELDNATGCEKQIRWTMQQDVKSRSDWVERNNIAICDGIVVRMDNVRACRRCLNQ